MDAYSADAVGFDESQLVIGRPHWGTSSRNPARSGECCARGHHVLTVRLSGTDGMQHDFRAPQCPDRGRAGVLEAHE